MAVHERDLVEENAEETIFFCGEQWDEGSLEHPGDEVVGCRKLSSVGQKGGIKRVEVHSGRSVAVIGHEKADSRIQAMIGVEQSLGHGIKLQELEHLEIIERLEGSVVQLRVACKELPNQWRINERGCMEGNAMCVLIVRNVHEETKDLADSEAF